MLAIGDAEATWHFALLALTMLALVGATLGLTVFLAVDYSRDRRRRLSP